MNFENAYKQYNNLVKYIAKKESNFSSIDTSISAEDLYQEGLMIIVKCVEKYGDKPDGEFGALVKTSLYRGLKEKAKNTTTISLDLSEEYEASVFVTPDTTMDNFEEEYSAERFAKLKELVAYDDVAYAILQELIEPSERTLWEKKMAEARRQTIAAQGANITRIKAGNGVQYTHIARALDLPKKVFEQGLNRLRELTRVNYGIAL